MEGLEAEGDITKTIEHKHRDWTEEPWPMMYWASAAGGWKMSFS